MLRPMAWSRVVTNGCLERRDESFTLVNLRCYRLIAVFGPIAQSRFHEESDGIMWKN